VYTAPECCLGQYRLTTFHLGELLRLYSLLVKSSWNVLAPMAEQDLFEWTEATETQESI
jgi:hypothetical protein